GLLLAAMQFVGVGSLFIIGLTGSFAGAVMALQFLYALEMIQGETMVGGSVALSLSRELAPVLTALMVTGRAGSAMATELGTMRVTEQIDAMETMAVNPVQYLVVPRIWASALVLPVLTLLFSLVGMAGCYLVSVKWMGVDHGLFMKTTREWMEPWDLWIGLIKAVVFGITFSVISCYKGFHAGGGARGVGEATTRAVVISSVMIFVIDYVLTALMF
ncbi:MAG: ABC transporter permease, partial [Deltaproteobacteria bacterium]|nr:ABC transporter permease [Deltaproteobacteria bacterium]